MKNFIAVILVLCCLAGLCAQVNSEPPVVDLLQYNRDYIRNGLNRDLGYEHTFLKEDAFRLWGWSRNGAVAYTITDSENWRGAVITHAVIFDLVDDKILWNGSIASDEHYDERNRRDNYDNAYNAFIAEFRNMSARHGIQTGQANFNPLPVVHNNTIISVSLIEVFDPAWSWNAVEFWIKFNRYSVTARRNNAVKTIGTVTRPNALSVVPCGYFQSPFENRALIITAHFQYMMEGECWVGYQLFGCHLTAGFN